MKNETVQGSQTKESNSPTTNQYPKRGRGASTRLENRINTATKLVDYLPGFTLFKKKNQPDIDAFGVELLNARIDMEAFKKARVQKTAKVRERSSIFNHRKHGLMKRCTQISRFFEGSKGIDPRYHDMLKDIIRQMRNSRKKQREEEAKAKSTPDRIVLSVSNHTSTYGHRLEGLYYILQIIEEVKEFYDPSNPLIQVKNLQKYYKELAALNTAVNQCTFTYEVAQKTSTNSALALMRSGRLLRKLIYATYDEDTPEYQLVKKLNLV